VGISPDAILTFKETLSLATFRNVSSGETVTAVACGPDKKSAILRALRTGLLDFLIIDDRTPLEVMNSDS
jgi:DNA-binding transcriptional regulator LsrR (DeoR family)